jgi:uncharacterized protein YbjT (DUF2867 family)
VLILGCGCRGRALTGALRERGHAVRATTRDAAHVAALEAAGAEPWVGDPDRLATLTEALDNVTILCWLLGSAAGAPDAVEQLVRHRLPRLLERTIDTTVRGVVYETRGSLDADLRAAGVAAVREARRTNEIPYATIDVDPSRHAAWRAAALEAVESLLARPQTLDSQK